MVKPRSRDESLGRDSYKDNNKLVRVNMFIERDVDLKVTIMAAKKRIHKSELLNQLLRTALERNKKEFLDGIDSRDFG